MQVCTFFDLLTCHPSCAPIDCSTPIHTLYIDFNFLLRLVFSRCVFENKKKEEMDEVIICDTLKYTLTLINKTIKPTSSVVISMDGPVPNVNLCKMREGLYKNVYDTYQETCIKQQNDPLYRGNIGGEYMHAFVGGTSFMQKIVNRLHSMINLNVFQNRNVIISASDEVGEGAIKILQHVRGNMHENHKICIYGMDDKKTMMCLSNAITDVFFCNDMDHDVVNIGDAIVQWLMDNKLYEKYMYDKIQISNDLVFIFMLCGNDVAPSIEFLRIRDQGWKYLIRTYVTCGVPIINARDASIIWDNLIHFINELSKLENVGLRKKYNKLLQRKLYGKSKPIGHETQIQMYHDEYLINTHHPLHDQYCSIFEYIDFRKPPHVWKPMYYQILFIGPSDINNIKFFCSDYLDSLLWCWEYYKYGHVASWSYKYPHTVAPTLSDFGRYFNEFRYLPRTYNVDILNGPLSPIAQLICILPRTMNHLLPTCLRSDILSPSSLLSIHYPTNELEIEFSLFTASKIRYAVPKLPPYHLIHIQHVCDARLSNFTTSELERNMYKPFVPPSCYRLI